MKKRLFIVLAITASIVFVPYFTGVISKGWPVGDIGKDSPIFGNYLQGLGLIFIGAFSMVPILLIFRAYYWIRYGK